MGFVEFRALTGNQQLALDVLIAVVYFVFGHRQGTRKAKRHFLRKAKERLDDAYRARLERQRTQYDQRLPSEKPIGII